MLNGFSKQQIISLLSRHTLWGRKACKEILRRKDEFIPLLIDILDNAINDPEPYMYDEKDDHIPAALLLAQMKASEAYPRLVKLISYDEETVGLLWGDMITEHYTHMLRDTFNGDSTLLPPLIENRSICEWARSMSILAYGMHYFDGRISREEITAFYRRLINKVYNKKPYKRDETVLSYVANSIREQRLEELKEDVKAAYERGGIDEFICEELEVYINDWDNPLFAADDLHIDDAIKNLDYWKWFRKEETSEDE